MANKWLAHVKKTMRRMKSSGTYKKGMGLKQVISAAKKTYSKHRGGDDSDSDKSKDSTPPDNSTTTPVDTPGKTPAETMASATGIGGRRRRSTKRTRRHRRR
jgi:hypothetical protein